MGWCSNSGGLGVRTFEVWHMAHFMAEDQLSYVHLRHFHFACGELSTTLRWYFLLVLGCGWSALWRGASLPPTAPALLLLPLVCSLRKTSPTSGLGVLHMMHLEALGQLVYVHEWHVHLSPPQAAVGHPLQAAAESSRMMCGEQDASPVLIVYRLSVGFTRPVVVLVVAWF